MGGTSNKKKAVSTPPEVIAMQHSEAEWLVGDNGQSGMPCASREVCGEIPLVDKQRPVCDIVEEIMKKEEEKNGPSDADKNQKDTKKARNEEKKELDDSSSSSSSSSSSFSCEILEKFLSNPTCFTTHGQVDVTQLQQMVREGYNYNNKYREKNKDDDDEDAGKYDQNDNDGNNNNDTSDSIHYPYSRTNYWDPRNAAKYNVSITRPSHDAWGIQKIVLLFCDDFMTKVYQMPWYNEYKDALQPIYNVLFGDNGTGNTQGKKKGKEKYRYQVVRALLASLPPGVTIPVHHDSGEWVKYTHRIHVPILVNDPTKILFRCGPTVSSMSRIDCQPGHVFEINNQAKHAVSNCDTDSRVHLILDYITIYDGDDDENVDVEQQQEGRSDKTTKKKRQKKQIRITEKSAPKVIKLEPGEVIVQTRRSIDRMKDQNTRPTPSYIILGAQKAGTTSLYEYIIQHPWIFPAKRRETHCFDWRWIENSDRNGNGKKNDSNSVVTTKSEQAEEEENKEGRQQQQQRRRQQEELEWCHKFFHVSKLQDHPSCLTGDSTPSYLLDSRRVIPRIQSAYSSWCLPDPDKQQQQQNPHLLKFFVMLRDPVKRALSHYAMVTSKEGNPAQLKTRGNEWRKLNFRQVIEQELDIMDECGLIPYWDRTTKATKSAAGTLVGTFNQEIFNQFVGSKEEDDAWDYYLQHHVPLKTGSYGLLTRGMYALQLRSWLRAFPPYCHDDDDDGDDTLESDDTTTKEDQKRKKKKMESQFLILKLESCFGRKKKNNNNDDNKEDDDDDGDDDDTNLTNKTMERVWDHLHVPYHPVEDDAAKNTRSYQPLSEPVQEYLQRFFEPHNKLLYQLFLQYNIIDIDDENENDEEGGGKKEWKDPWPYPKSTK